MQATRIARLAIVLGGLLGLAVAPVAAQNLLGFDDMSCAAWSQSKADAEQRAAYVVWIRGFLSGHNYALPKQQVSTISSGTIENHINRYCSTTPTGQFSDGAMRLSDQFSGRNQPVRK